MQPLARRGSKPRSFSRAVAFAAALALAPANDAQDNILIYANSLIDDQYETYLDALIVESGRPAPSLTTFIVNNGRTRTYLNNSDLITNSLPSGETWDAVVIVGGTIEMTTLFNFGYSPEQFLASMQGLASAFYAHSPNGKFIGHQTGADHPNSNRYPAWFPDAATWLSYPVRAYDEAKSLIDAAHPNNGPMQIAPQGIAMAETTGYAIALFENDLHHFSAQGEAWIACLHYLQIYGGRICDLQLDFNGSSPLVTQLLADNIDEEKWRRIAGWADASQPRALRKYPGSDSDFQMRSAIDSTRTHLCPDLTASVGQTLNIRLTSPLGSVDSEPAAVYVQRLNAGALPNGGAIPGLILDASLMATWWSVPDLTAGGVVSYTIPAELSGATLWIQATSRGPTGDPTFPLMLSDAQSVTIF